MLLFDDVIFGSVLSFEESFHWLLLRCEVCWMNWAMNGENIETPKAF